ncbi:MAG: tetratricopeptide repeat protein [Gemmatimonadota bacterium]
MIATVAMLAVSCEGGETAIGRGDRFWADSNYTAALAEYRLAVTQSGGDNESLARAAHAYAVTGQLAPARELYDQLLKQAPSYADQAVMDYLDLAKRAQARGDQFGVAQAVTAALAAQPGLSLPQYDQELARYYTEANQPDRAMEHYRRALAEAPPDSAPRILYDMGLVEEGRSNFGRALSYMQAFREAVAPMDSTGRRSSYGHGPWRSLLPEARWHIGNCSFQLAKQAQAQGRMRDALDDYTTVTGLGVPENIQDQAWFQEGEVLRRLGRADDALFAYRKVLDLHPSLTGQLVQRAQQRIDQIRFGRPPDDTSPPS